MNVEGRKFSLMMALGRNVKSKRGDGVTWGAHTACMNRFRPCTKMWRVKFSVEVLCAEAHNFEERNAYADFIHAV